jgi:hypothetical protein
MECTAFEALVLPASLSSVLFVGACWLAATIVGRLRRLFLDDAEHDGEWRDESATEWDPNWQSEPFGGSPYDPS